MTQERWEQLKQNIKKRFEVVDERAGDLIIDTGDGPIKQGSQEMLVVRTPVGKIRLVREIRPLVIQKKFHYTHRQGASAQTEYTFSDTEKTDRLRVFKWNELDEDWREIDPRDAEGLV